MTGIGTWFQAIWDTIKTSMETAGTTLILLLPASPFETLSNTDVSGYMSWLNWLVPVGQMVSILEAWCSAILVYYVYVTILRWIKAIQ